MYPRVPFVSQIMKKGPAACRNRMIVKRKWPGQNLADGRARIWQWRAT